MAGIGFQLKRMIEKDTGFIHKIRSYGLAVVSLNGPMLLCLFAVTIAGLLLRKDTYSTIPRDHILVTVTYTFMLSSITTGIYSLILTRYISDCIYQKEYKKVMASFYGGILPSTIFSLLISGALTVFAKLPIKYAFCILILLSIVSIIWLEMIYLSAANDHTGIIAGFAAGNIVTIILLLFIRLVSVKYEIFYIFFCFIAGFFVTALLLLVQIRNVFGEEDRSYFEWFTYIRKFPDLWLTGIFYTVGLYFPCLYYRFTDENYIVNGFFTVQKDFDFPFFIGVLSIIPGLIFFVVKFETELHIKCNKFFDAILNYGTYNEIKFFMRRLKNTVLLFFYKLCIVQLAVMSLLIFFSFKVGKGPFADFKTYFILWMCVLAMGFTVIMYVVKIVLLYFDERKFAYYISAFYMVSVMFMTTLIGRDGLPGLGFMIASAFTVIIAYILLLLYLKDMKNQVFMIK
ncbi:MAG TPA: exopolysaccharide Pel transporter PelG [Acetivibrio clariflavus]|nr:exopolysaccharide Pel transporter PelG [Acetivibrio clariflavus]